MNILELIYYTHTCDLGWSDDIKLTCMARMLRGISSRYCLMLKCHVLILIRSSKANSRINRPSVHTWECKHSETYDVLKTTSLSHHEEIRFSSERDRMHHIKQVIFFRFYVSWAFQTRVSKPFPSERCLCCIPEPKANEMEILESSLHKHKTTKCWIHAEVINH